MREGGSEIAPMSTTTSLRVALNYAVDAHHALLFKLRTDSFMGRGANISFLSAFPAEEEVLFPPLSFLRPTDKKVLTHEHGATGRILDVVEVVPHFGGS